MWALAIVWWGSWLILLGYYLFVFSPRKQKMAGRTGHDTPGVSVVIAIKNGSDRLLENLPSILAQSYPAFEVIIVDDHSDMDERRKLNSIQGNHLPLTIVRSERAPGKKNALLTGIEKAKYGWILCTDADCRPVSDQWIRSMVQESRDAGMVLGYSPYRQQKGLLNLLVRFETAMTGMQYLSWAMRGRPYMGVGRNLLYAKDLFLEMNPYQHQHLPYGDDDLWVQQAASKAKVAVCFEPKAHVMSDPPLTWRSWWRQKHRHVSAAHHYTKIHWWQPGLFGMSLILHWAILPFLSLMMYGAWILGPCLLGLAIRWMVYSRWAGRLNEKQTLSTYPVLEILYTFYLSLVGMMTLWAKKKTWN